uniref:Acid phosphatase n=1 Tax=Megaselia scalaris TaxID=36166 RepID=T1GPQ3_MEGSC
MASSQSVRNQRIAMSFGFVILVIVLLYCLIGTVYSGAISRSRPARFQQSSKKDTLQLLHVVFRHGARTPADTYPLDPYFNETFYPNGWGQVFRHGARTPADTYPLDPYFNETFYPNGWGQVTNDGKDKLYKMGIWLHDRYGKFLGEYMPDSVYAQATGVSRTHVSLQTVLAGLYRPRNTALDWNRNLNWLPIPVFSQPLEEDSLLLVRTPCPRYYEARDDVYKLPEIASLHEKYKDMMKELSDHTGKHIENAEDVADVYTTLLAEKEFACPFLGPHVSK